MSEQSCCEANCGLQLVLLALVYVGQKGPLQQHKVIVGLANERPCRSRGTADWLTWI